ncbi:MAG: hypothetical protein MMC23_002086 [Stictis urceolatum]|nr:hypothetical protein [Stictis urceolata]
MHMLWTRALQVKSTCRCPSCVNPRQALARRVNTAPPPRRLLRPGDLFTAFFSTTVFVAAAADARYKQFRREELDGVLLLAKEDLRALDEDQVRRLQALGLSTNQTAGQPPTNIAEGDATSQSTQSRGAFGQQLWERDEGLRNEELPGLSESRPNSLQNSYALPTEVSQQTSYLEHAPQVGSDVSTCDVVRAQLSATCDPISQSKREPPLQSRGELESIQVQSQENQKPMQIKKQTNQSKRYARTRFHAEIDSAVPSQDALSKILLDSQPIDPCVGRSTEAAWSSRSTPSLSQRHLLQAQNAVAILIHRIILSRIHHTDVFPVLMPNGHTQEYTCADEDWIVSAIRELSQTRRGIISSAKKDSHMVYDMQPLSFPVYNHGGADRRSEQLDGTARQEDELLQLLAQPLQIDELLSRLCSTLARQIFAPNIHIFNILLIKLTERHIPNIAKYVIDAMEQTHVIQNEITHTAVLNAHADAGNSSKFIDHLDNMDGLKGRGYLPAKGPQVIARRSPESIVVAYEPHKQALAEFELPEAKVMNFKVPRTQDMYEAIIGGLLGFSRLERALEEYSRMIRSGFQPTVQLYQSFLKYCVKVKAWKIGWNIWLQLCNDVHAVTPVLCYWMLQLCASCGRTREFETISSSAEMHGIVSVPLDIAHFQWTEGEFEQTLKYSNSVQRLQRHTPIPSWDAEPPREAKFDITWPANLYTLVQEQFSTLISWKKDMVGYCLNEEGHDLVIKFHKRSKRPGQWLTIDHHSGRVEFVHQGKWSQREVFDHRKEISRVRPGRRHPVRQRYESV